MLQEKRRKRKTSRLTEVIWLVIVSGKERGCEGSEGYALRKGRIERPGTYRPTKDLIRPLEIRKRRCAGIRTDQISGEVSRKLESFLEEFTR